MQMSNKKKEITRYFFSLRMLENDYSNNTNNNKKYEII